jgi:hypothetical protein
LEVCIYYGSYFVASLLMMKMVSRGTRTGLWSEIYEIAMCFRMSWAVLTTVAQPYAARPFDITPKAIQQDRSEFAVRCVIPHLLTCALLIVGLGTGIARWLNGTDFPGIQITVVWGAVNLVLLCVTIVASIDAQQWRKMSRLPVKLRCTLFNGKHVYDGITEDLSESGALIRIPVAALESHDEKERNNFSMTLTGPTGRFLTLKVLVRAERTERGSGEAAVGVEFIDLDEKTVNALIVLMFGDENVWDQTASASGIWKNIWWLLSAIKAPLSPSRTSFRRARRVSCDRNCEAVFQRQTLNGTIRNVSDRGLMAEFTGTSEQLGEEGCIHMDCCVLEVRRMWSRDRDGKVLAGFQIQRIKEGQKYWEDLLS